MANELINGEKLEVERLTLVDVCTEAKYRSIVLDAKSDGNGNITLTYADPIGYREQNSKTTYAQYQLQAGITNRDEKGRTIALTSHNINWDEVKTVSGKTYGTQKLMREKGFDWDAAQKIWFKKE